MKKKLILSFKKPSTKTSLFLRSSRSFIVERVNCMCHRTSLCNSQNKNNVRRDKRILCPWSGCWEKKECVWPQTQWLLYHQRCQAINKHTTGDIVHVEHPAQEPPWSEHRDQSGYAVRCVMRMAFRSFLMAFIWGWMPSNSNSSTHANLFSSGSLCLQLVKMSSFRSPVAFFQTPIALVPSDTSYHKQNRSFLESDETFSRPNWERCSVRRWQDE